MTAVAPHGQQILDVDGLATAIIESGRGEVLLLIHGSGPGLNGMLSFEPVVPGLARNYRTLVADMPGYGRSAPLPDADIPANVARHMLRLLDKLGIQSASIIGHSRGGRIGCELALLAPERVRRLVVVASGSVAPQGLLQDNGEWTAPAIAMVRWGADGNTSLAKFKETYYTQVIDPAHFPHEMLESAYYDAKKSGVLDYFVRQMAENDSLNFYHRQDGTPFLDKLRGLNVPTLVLWGREDRCGPYQRALGLIDIMPNMEFHLLPRCGHFVMMDRPDAFAQTVTDFLQRDDDVEPYNWINHRERKS